MFDDVLIRLGSISRHKPAKIHPVIQGKGTSRKAKPSEMTNAPTMTAENITIYSPAIPEI
jgi:hypothetical protein